MACRRPDYLRSHVFCLRPGVSGRTLKMAGGESVRMVKLLPSLWRRVEHRWLLLLIFRVETCHRPLAFCNLQLGPVLPQSVLTPSYSLALLTGLSSKLTVGGQEMFLQLPACARIVSDSVGEELERHNCSRVAIADALLDTATGLLQVGLGGPPGVSRGLDGGRHTVRVLPLNFNFFAYLYCFPLLRLPLSLLLSLLLPVSFAFAFAMFICLCVCQRLSATP